MYQFNVTILLLLKESFGLGSQTNRRDPLPLNFFDFFRNDGDPLPPKTARMSHTKAQKFIAEAIKEFDQLMWTENQINLIQVFVSSLKLETHFSMMCKIKAFKSQLLSDNQ